MIKDKDVLHAPGLHEYAICGLAYDAYETGDHEYPVVFARLGELVTCDECRAQIDHARRSFKRYRVIANPDN